MAMAANQVRLNLLVDYSKRLRRSRADLEIVKMTRKTQKDKAMKRGQIFKESEVESALLTSIKDEVIDLEGRISDLKNAMLGSLDVLVVTSYGHLEILTRISPSFWGGTVAVVPLNIDSAERTRIYKGKKTLNYAFHLVDEVAVVAPPVAAAVALPVAGALALGPLV